MPSSKYGFENGHFPVSALYHFEAVSIGGLPRERRERQEKAQKAPLLFIRQYLRLAVYLLMGVIVMLGIIADRLH